MTEVPIPDFIHDQQDQVIGIRLAVPGRSPILAVTRGDVDFASQNRPYAGLFGLIKKLDGPEDVSVIRYGNALHAHCFGLFQQPVYGYCAVKEAEFRMYMEIYKI